MTTHDGPPPGPPPGAPPPRPPAGASSGGGWRSEEDFVLARLAVSLGVLDEGAVREALAAQGAALARGVALGLGQVLVQSGRLRPEQALLLRAELARAWRPCPACGAGRYLAAGPTARAEPCRRCGGPLHVPPADRKSVV